MKYRTLGKTGLNISVIGIGTWQYGGEWGKKFDQSEVDAILEKAKELGINFIDTAECYGDHLSESLIGKAIQQEREKWIVATKFGHQFHNNFERTDHWSAKEVVKQLDDSLKALRTDYVDLYQFHSGSNEAFDNDDLWTALDKQVQSGKVRHLGISISSKGNVVHQVKKATDVKASVVQVVYNRLEREPEQEVLPLCEKQNLGVLARVPLASGFLSGKYKPDARFQEDDVRNKQDQQKRREMLELVEKIAREEVPENINMAQWALAWCLQHPAVTSVIPGCKSVEQVEANAKAADLQMVKEDHPQAIQLNW